MLKINKTTHLSILITFIVLFTGAYFYYMFNDIKMLKKEMNRLFQENISILDKISQNSNKSISTNINEPSYLPTNSSDPKNIIPVTQISINDINDSDTDSVLTNDIKEIINYESDEEDEINIIENDKIIQNENIGNESEIIESENEIVESKIIESENEIIESESKIIESENEIIESENENVENQKIENENNKIENEIIENENQINKIINKVNNDNIYTLDYLKKIKYDDIKTICKIKNISTKGTKDVLIKKIMESQKNI